MKQLFKIVMQVFTLPLILAGLSAGFIYEQFAGGFRKGVKIGETYP